MAVRRAADLLSGKRVYAFECEGNGVLLNFHKAVVLNAVVHIGGIVGKWRVGADDDGIAFDFVFTHCYGCGIGNRKHHTLHRIAIGG